MGNNISGRDKKGYANEQPEEKTETMRKTSKEIMGVRQVVGSYIR